LLGYQNNFVETLKIMSNAAENFDILATSLSVLHCKKVGKFTQIIDVKLHK